MDLRIFTLFQLQWKTLPRFLNYSAECDIIENCIMSIEQNIRRRWLSFPAESDTWDVQADDADGGTDTDELVMALTGFLSMAAAIIFASSSDVLSCDFRESMDLWPETVAIFRSSTTCCCMWVMDVARSEWLVFCLEQLAASVILRSITPRMLWESGDFIYQHVVVSWGPAGIACQHHC